jgi:hypothetical protein
MSSPVLGPNRQAIDLAFDQATRAGIVRVGKRWRLISGPWPTPASADCTLLQFLDGVGRWTTLFGWGPDGSTIGGSGPEEPGPTTYRLMVSMAGQPASGVRLASLLLQERFTLPMNLTGAAGVARVPPTANATLSIKVVRAGNVVADAVVAISATTGAFAFTLAAEFVTQSGDILEVWGPAAPDPTLADVSFTITGLRSLS